LYLDARILKLLKGIESPPNQRSAQRPVIVHVPLGKLEVSMSALVSHTPEAHIREIYGTLSRAWGPQHWWPAQSRFEVIVGAYLTQNTNWSNVEIAMRKLRAARVLNVAGIRKTPLGNLEQLVRSSGYFRQKASRLKAFIRFLDEEYGGSLAKMFSQPTERLREQLLSLNGVGPETADSILLYAGQHPVFVVDAYTRRLAARHQLAPENATYEELRTLFERALAGVSAPQRAASPRSGGASHPPSRMSLTKRSAPAQVFNEMHGFIVGVGKTYCRKSQPDCEHCPLKCFLPAS
jgi:endonuclease III related protein